MTAHSRAWIAIAVLIVSACGRTAIDDNALVESPDAAANANAMDGASQDAPSDRDAMAQDVTTAMGAGGASVFDASTDAIDAPVLDPDATTVDGGDGEGGVSEAAADATVSVSADAQTIDAADGEVVEGGPDVAPSTGSSDGACAWTLIRGQDISTGSGGPLSGAIGDLNGDSKQDVVVADPNGNSAGVFLGRGNGTFQPAVSYPAGMSPWSVAIADLNGDRHPDLVVPNFLYGVTATVSVLMGRGDGTFGVAAPYSVGVDPESVVVGDLNGDGHPDLIVSNWLDATLSVLLGHGDGTFGPQTTYPAYWSAGPAALGDLNGDGKLDVVVADTRTFDGPSGVVSVLLGNGDGTLKPRVLLNAGFDPSFVAMGDLNGDGRLDLVVADSASYAAEVLLGNGDGTFQAYTQWPAGKLPASVAIADLNADGAPDLALTNSEDGTLSVLLGNGDGTFAPQVTFATDPSPGTVAAGDLNGDGYADLAVGLSGSSAVDIFLSRCAR